MNVKLFGIDINSDDDDDYVPVEDQAMEVEKEPKGCGTKRDISAIFAEMKDFDAYRPKECNKTAKQIAAEVMESKEFE